MLGTDIDPQNFSYANENIERNRFSERIRIKLNTAEDTLISPRAFGHDKLDFTMCNPPFYSSAEDLAVSSAGKSGPPSAVCTGAEIEMICPGGDAGFVLRMVEESRELKDTVRWYTSMLGKLSSVHQVIDRLKEIGINNWAVTLLRAGNKTRRWAVGWSYGDRRPSNVSNQSPLDRRQDTNRNSGSPGAVILALIFCPIQQLRLSTRSDLPGRKRLICSIIPWERSAWNGNGELKSGLVMGRLLRMYGHVRQDVSVREWRWNRRMIEKHKFNLKHSRLEILLRSR